MEQRLTQPELEELSAFLDGELDAQAAQKVQRLIDSDSAWAISYQRLQSLDGALDSYDVPAASADLASRVVSGVRRRDHRSRLVRWLVPVSAAAAVLLAVLAFVNLKSGVTGGNSGVGTTPTLAVNAEEKAIDEALTGLEQPDRLAVENMDFFRDYEVLDNFDTLQAIDRLEQGEG